MKHGGGTIIVWGIWSTTLDSTTELWFTNRFYKIKVSIEHQRQMTSSSSFLMFVYLWFTWRSETESEPSLASEGYSEASDSVSSSWIQQPPAGAPSPSIAHPFAAAALKQEVSCFTSSEQAFPRAVGSPQLPLIQPTPLFPANVLLQPSPPLPPTASSAQRITAESCAPSKSPGPESSAGGLREQGARGGPKGYTQAEASAKTLHPCEDGSGAEPVGNLSKDRVEGEEPAASDRKKTAAEENGSESDSSVVMIRPSTLEVINVDESDGESPAVAEPAGQPEVPQSSEVCCSSTQTSQENEPERWESDRIGPQVRIWNTVRICKRFIFNPSASLQSIQEKTPAPLQVSSPLLFQTRRFTNAWLKMLMFHNNNNNDINKLVQFP